MDSPRSQHKKTTRRYLSGFIIALLLVMPNLVWIALDKGVWKGDPVGYALNSVWLHLYMITNLPLWKWNMFHGYKAPLIFWVGQFFVPLGKFIGSINFALLLIQLIATYATLVFSFRSFESLFRSKGIAICGCLIIAASPLFNGLSTGFWIEPIQVAITSWFIYALTKASAWNFYFSLAQFVISFSLAMLTKVSSPVYIAVPAMAFWIEVFRSKTSLKMSKRHCLLLFASLLFLIPTVVFYFMNFRALMDFARYASTSPLYGSDLSKTDLWIGIMSNGIFFRWGLAAAIIILLAGIVKTVKQNATGSFKGIFLVAFFQIAVFFILWIKSSNADPRYFVPALPFFAILGCWGLAAINHKAITVISASMFLIQFVLVNGFAFGLVELTPAYGMIRPVITKPDRDMRVIQEIMPLATRDSSLIIDLTPELGVIEIQYELAKQDLTANWASSIIDILVFLNFDNQKIDTARIDADAVWHKVLAYNPDFYVTWNSRQSLISTETEMRRIDKYHAATVPVRWEIADKMRNSDLYEKTSFASHPELLVYKRCD